MQQNYYQILGVNQKVGSRELRKTYRLLAVKYHPDSSEIPGAHHYFIQINEAYQTLSDPIKRRRYDLTLDLHKNTSFTHDANVAQPYYKNTYRPPTKASEEDKEREFDRYIPYTRLSAILTSLFSLLLIFDFLLISPTNVQQVEKLIFVEGPMGEISCNIKGGGETFLLDIEKVKKMNVGDYYRLQVSPVLNIVSHVEMVSSEEDSFENEDQVECFFPHYGIFNVFFFFIILMIGASTCGLLIPKIKSGLLFNFGLLNILLFIITFVITYNS